MVDRLILKKPNPKKQGVVMSITYAFQGKLLSMDASELYEKLSKLIHEQVDSILDFIKLF